MGLGLITCGEEEVVRGVHTLIAGVVQVYHRLPVVEEEEKVRKVEQQVEREDQGEDKNELSPTRRSGEQISCLQHDLGECLLAVGLRDVFS